MDDPVKTPAAEPAPVRRPRKRLTRQELTPLAREAIFAAASRVVGQLGYAEASVARITEAAGIAQGTFYLYFENRQSLFDELLPHARQEMLELVRSRISGSRDFFEMEERGMLAFLEYLQVNPGFFRILNEAETVAPEAYRRHYQDVAGRYARLLGRAAAAGQVRPLDDAETQTVAYLMMGARISLYQLCVRLRPEPGVTADQAVAHHMAWARAWLSAPPAKRRAGSSRNGRIQA